MVGDSPIGALLLGFLVAWAASSPVAAQGLREDARGLIDNLEIVGADACAQLAATQALLQRIERSEAETFMSDEVAQLTGYLDELTTRCEVQTAAREASDEERQSLLRRCIGLGQSRAFCLLLDECGPVSQQTRRMRDFWQSAHEGCLR